MDLGKISKYRSELMGFAIIIVMLFHVPFPRSDTFFGLKRMGNLGVDIFFFLSGIGLWYSWVKQQDFKRFYLNRILRIYPAWFLIAGYYYISRFHGTTTMSYIDLAGDILINWDFWLHDEGTFWYVPATMMLYLFAPPYMELIRRHPIMRWLVVLPLMWCIIVQYVTPIHQALGHIEIFWSRVPIFFLGINCAEYVRQKRRIDHTAWWLVAVFFIVSLSACVWLEQMLHGRFPLYTERMLYIVLTITTVIMLSEAFDRLDTNSIGHYATKTLAWIGGISLEIYLLHVEFIMKPIQAHHLGYWLTFILTLVISLPIAWIISKVCSVITKTIKTYVLTT